MLGIFRRYQKKLDELRLAWYTAMTGDDGTYYRLLQEQITESRREQGLRHEDS